MKAGTKLLGAVTVAGWLAFAGTHPAAIRAVLTDIPAGTSGNVALGQKIAAEYGWTGAQWSCEDTLFEGESGWSQYADTRQTGLDPAGATVFAYGIGQARGHGSVINGVTAPYPASAQAANPASLGGSSDPATQLRWADGYIASVYGTPCSALAAKRASGNKGY
jgi:hypothetical protein